MYGTIPSITQTMDEICEEVRIGDTRFCMPLVCVFFVYDDV